MFNFDLNDEEEFILFLGKYLYDQGVSDDPLNCIFTAYWMNEIMNHSSPYDNISSSNGHIE